MTDKLKILCFILFLQPAVVPGLYGQDIQLADSSKDYKSLIRIGENLTYIVKYAFLNIGEINIIVEKKDTLKGRNIYKSKAYIDSYEGLPFVNMHQVYQSWFDSTLFPVYFEGEMYKDEDTTFTKYYFINDSLVHVVKGNLNPSKTFLDTVINLHMRFQDGFSLLYFARFNFRQKDTTLVGCFINEDTAETKIEYYRQSEPVSIDAVDYDIDCLKLTGETNFTGIFGLTGHFEGWFSNDAYLVPILARLNVIIGSISVELIDWKDKKWMPPEYKN